LKKINIAFGSVPKDGGTFTFYKNIRPALELHGITMYCVAVGKEQAMLWEESYADTNTILLAPDTYSIKKQAKSFVTWCESNDINIVMGINSEAILSAIPHLPKSIRVVSRCANAFDHGYRIAMSGKERLQAIFALTPRLQEDLINLYNADPKMLHLIPNGIDPRPFKIAANTPRGHQNVLQLGYLGRLEHNQKGVMHLPDLVKVLVQMEIPFHLTIAGKGKDREKLEAALVSYISQGFVSFKGALNAQQVPVFLSETDVYIFPSHFEGCPNALLEAMMAGAVPVSWIIKGITDYVLKNGETGFLHSLGNYTDMAESIKKVHDDRSLLRLISHNAAVDARMRFTPELTASAYAKVFHQVMEMPLPDIKVLPWNKFRSDSNFKQKGDGWLPRSIKFKLKRVLNLLT